MTRCSPRPPAHGFTAAPRGSCSARVERCGDSRSTMSLPSCPAPGRCVPVRRARRFCSSSPISPCAEMARIPLGPGVEFDLVRQMEERWGPLAAHLGDDAAVLQVPRGEQLLLSTDTSLEDVHFRRGWLSLREIGYRAVTAALSDLAAMAATPVGVLVALQLAPDDRARLLEIAD